MGASEASEGSGGGKASQYATLELLTRPVDVADKVHRIFAAERIGQHAVTRQPI